MFLPLKQILAASPIMLLAQQPLPPAAAGEALTQPLDWDWSASISQIVQEPVLPAPEPPPELLLVHGTRM